MLEELLRHYLGYGNCALLANLIDITLLTFRPHYALPSKCDVLSTLPSLQHDFCALWNEIALETQNGKDLIPTLILDNIRPVYIALHTDTDASPKAFPATATEIDDYKDSERSRARRYFRPQHSNTMEVSRRSSLSKPLASTPDIAADSLRPVDSQEGLGNRSYDFLRGMTLIGVTRSL